MQLALVNTSQSYLLALIYKRYGQLLAADVTGGIGYEAVVEMGIFLLEDGQVILALIGVAVVNDDDFKWG